MTKEIENSQKRKHIFTREKLILNWLENLLLEERIFNIYYILIKCRIFETLY